MTGIPRKKVTVVLEVPAIASVDRIKQELEWMCRDPKYHYGNGMMKVVHINDGEGVSYVSF